MTDTHLTTPTKFLEIDGDRFAYRRWGQTGTDAPPLLFFQHFRGGLDHWDPLMTDGLADGREVILLDGRGVGASSGTPRNRVEDMADDAAACVTALGLTRIDVMGFSLGGFVAQDLTRRHSHLVRKLLLLGTRPRGGDATITPRVFEAASQPVPALDNFLYLFFGPSEAAQDAGRAFWQRRHERADQDAPNGMDVGQAQVEATMAFQPPEDEVEPFAHLREIVQPTLVVNGVNDVMIASINSWHMVQNIPNAQLIVYPDAGHGAHFQYPERFLKHAVQFLAE